jgi:hypothetical protein
MAQIKAFAFVAAAALMAGSASLGAQQTQTPPPTQTQQPPATQKPEPSKALSQRAEMTETFTIEAIDYKTREVVLKDKSGSLNTVVAGPQIQRFDNLKVGDKVTFHYYESVLYSLRKQGQASSVGDSGSSMVREKGPKPGGTYTQQMTASVVVTALDTKVPSITVKTDEGKTMSFKVEDKKNLEGLNIGDHVDIVYSRALAVKVE